jgi:hypothetical protein
MTAHRARSLTGDVLLLFAYPAALTAWVGATLAVGRTGFNLAISGALVIWPIACLPGFATRDLVGFASLAVPAAGIGILGVATLVLGRDPTLVLLVGCAWIVVWTFGGRRIWPWWSRTVLRRHRDGSPESGLLRAWHEITSRWRRIRDRSESVALWDEVLALEQFETDRTRPVITGIFVLWDLAHTQSTAPERFERVNARLNQEWDRLFEVPRFRIRWPLARAVAVTDRPTRGTWLEYAFPDAEALVAVATEPQLRQIAVASARRAADAAGVATDRIEAALDMARDRTVDPDLRAEIQRMAVAARRRSRELADEATAVGSSPMEAPARDAWRASLALNAVSEAIAPELTRVMVANAVSQAIRSEMDAAAEGRHIRLIQEVVGHEAATRARRIPIPGRSDEGTAAAKANIIPSILGTAAGSLGGLARLILIAAAAGSIGTLLQQLSWEWVAGLPRAASVDGLLGVVLVGVIAHALVRVSLGRPPFLDVVAIYVAAGASSALVRPLFDVASLLVAPVVGDGWVSLFADPENLAPFAPFRALTFAAALIVSALLFKPSDEPASRAAASIEA